MDCRLVPAYLGNVVECFVYVCLLPYSELLSSYSSLTTVSSACDASYAIPIIHYFVVLKYIRLTNILFLIFMFVCLIRSICGSQESSKIPLEGMERKDLKGQ